MLPASMFGTISTSAQPATGEEIFLTRAASASTAASRSSGPSTIPPTICPRSAILARIAPSSGPIGTFLGANDCQRVLRDHQLFGWRLAANEYAANDAKGGTEGQ